MKYSVRLNYIVEQTALIEVHADSEEDAIEQADNIAPRWCEEVSRNLEDSEVEEIEEWQNLERSSDEQSEDQ